MCDFFAFMTIIFYIFRWFIISLYIENGFRMGYAHICYEFLQKLPFFFFIKKNWNTNMQNQDKMQKKHDKKLIQNLELHLMYCVPSLTPEQWKFLTGKIGKTVISFERNEKLFWIVHAHLNLSWRSVHTYQNLISAKIKKSGASAHFPHGILCSFKW